MSIESMALALHHSRATGAAKLVLLGIANHDGDGGAWPSIAKLAQYANVSPRNVQKAIDKLEELHEIRRHIQRGGTTDMLEHERPNRYDFLLTCPPDCDGSKHHRTRSFSPVELDIEGVSVATPGDGSDTPGVSVATPKPSSNQPSTKTKKEPHVGRRARTRSVAYCGHDLVTDRHCSHGCPLPKEDAA